MQTVPISMLIPVTPLATTQPSPMQSPNVLNPPRLIIHYTLSNSVKFNATGQPLWVSTLLDLGADPHTYCGRGRVLEMARKWAVGYPTAGDDSRLVLEILENALNPLRGWKKERKGRGNAVGHL